MTTHQPRQKQTNGRQKLAHRFFAASACLCAALPGLVMPADAYQSHDSLLTCARDFLETNIAHGANESAEIALGRLDPRLRLKTCDTPLQAFLPGGTKPQGKINVGIRCPDEKNWTVYLSAELKIFSEVLVSARPLVRGETLSVGDTIPSRMDVSALNTGYYQQSGDLVGKIVKQSIPAGRALTPNMLRAPLMIRRGDEVTIIAASEKLQVRMKGKALADAAFGERVSVQNLGSKRIVEGTAVEPGHVQVFM